MGNLEVLVRPRVSLNRFAIARINYASRIDGVVNHHQSAFRTRPTRTDTAKMLT